MGYQKIRIPIPRSGGPHGPRGKREPDDTAEQLELARELQVKQSPRNKPTPENKTMDNAAYQNKTRVTAKYPPEKAIEYLALGLASEAGEVAGKVKKVIRDKGGVYGLNETEAISHELGDVLWYVARLADEFGLTLSGIMDRNIEKLLDRLDRDAIKGSGDDR